MQDDWGRSLIDFAIVRLTEEENIVKRGVFGAMLRMIIDREIAR